MFLICLFLANLQNGNGKTDPQNNTETLANRQNERKWQNGKTEAVKRRSGKMQNVAKLDIPLIVEINAGENWEKAH